MLAKSKYAIGIITIFFGLFAIYFLSYSRKTANSKIQYKIPTSEKKEIKELFRFLIFNELFAYTIFGDKPISLSCFNVPRQMDYKNLRSYFHAFRRSNTFLSKAWNEWEKNKAALSFSNFIFKNFECKTKNLITIIVINKKAFLDIASQHLDDFRNVLGFDISPEELLRQCEEHFFMDIFKNHQGLIGTMLGYGRHNAWQFHRWDELSEWGEDRQFHLKDIRASPTTGFNSIQEEFQYYQEKHKPFIKDFLLETNQMVLPSFVADPDHSETKKLKTKYRKQRKEILKSFQKKDFFEVTLKALKGK